MKKVSRILEIWFKNFRLREAWFKSNTAPQLYWVRNSLNATVLVDGKARKVESPKSGDLPYKFTHLICEGHIGAA